MYKKFTLILFKILIVALLTFQAKATEECFEGLSRSIFKFNLAFDNAILEPVAKGYNKLPEPLKKGTSNFTSNISMLLSIPNSILQGNLKQFAHSTGSVLINSTAGVLGFFNPAERLGLKPHKEDVGQTLGSFGVGTLFGEQIAIKASNENTKEIETIEARNKPTWLPPDPILSLGVRARLIYERFRAKSDS